MKAYTGFSALFAISGHLRFRLAFGGSLREEDIRLGKLAELSELAEDLQRSARIAVSRMFAFVGDLEERACFRELRELVSLAGLLRHADNIGGGAHDADVRRNLETVVDASAPQFATHHL